MKAIKLPPERPIPDPSVSIQAWETNDFCNSAYNEALLDVYFSLTDQGISVEGKPHET
jgi:hypothetical protein